jgi:4-azaleucine resistance transporter AzlC
VNARLRRSEPTGGDPHRIRSGVIGDVDKVRAEAATPCERFPERREITRAAVGIGLYAAAFGMTFGAVSVTSGLSLEQTMLLSVVMFTGASQFAFVGVIAAGGSPLAAIPPALLLGVRNAFYGVPVTEILRPRGIARLWTAHFVIDESTAMAVAQGTPRARRYAFWSTGLILFALWSLGSLAGGVIGNAINPSDFGLDAAAPAIFLALLYPQLKRPGTPIVAILGALLALVLVPIAPAGVPVIAAAAAAILGGILHTNSSQPGNPSSNAGAETG